MQGNLSYRGYDILFEDDLVVAEAVGQDEPEALQLMAVSIQMMVRAIDQLWEAIEARSCAEMIERQPVWFTRWLEQGARGRIDLRDVCLV